MLNNHIRFFFVSWCVGLSFWGCGVSRSEVKALSHTVIFAYEEARIFSSIIEANGAVSSVGANGEHVVSVDRILCTNVPEPQCDIYAAGRSSVVRGAYGRQLFNLLSIRDVWLPSNNPNVLKLGVRSVSCQFGGTATNWSQCRMFSVL